MRYREECPPRQGTPDYVIKNIRNLKNERIARGLNTVEFTAEVKITTMSLYYYETLHHWPTLRTYNKIAEFLNWKLWEKNRRQTMKDRRQARAKTKPSIPVFVMDNICDLRAERVSRCMTTTEFCEKTGVSKDALKGYENLHYWPSPANYNRIARYLGWQLWQI